MNWDPLIELVVTPLGPVSLAALISAVFLYINLSHRLGAVTKMPPHYRWFLVGNGFLSLALGMSILRSAAYLSCREKVAFLTTPAFGLFLFHIPLFIGTTICVITTWRYWSWLLTNEHES
jgi:hypothetical protein